MKTKLDEAIRLREGNIVYLTTAPLTRIRKKEAELRWAKWQIDIAKSLGHNVDDIAPQEK